MQLIQGRGYNPWLGFWFTPKSFPVAEITKVYATLKEFRVKKCKNG